MSGTQIGLAASVFVACAVEAVEALTIVLAVGATRSWRSAISGTAAAAVALVVVVASLGAAVRQLPLDSLRTVVGGLLLVFGLQWLRKAILRAAGLKAKHDERLIYREVRDAAGDAAASTSGFDGYAFAVSFKGVLLEGLEVAFIVITFGANQHDVGLAATAAGAAVLLVIAAGAAARAPLAKVPENTMKFSVGVLLSSFGMFWGAEGVGAHWPGGEAALPVIVLGMLLLAVGMARRLSAGTPAAGSAANAHPTKVDPPKRSSRINRIAAALLAVWEFVVGDDWQTAVGVALALAATASLGNAIGPAWWVLAVAVTGLLARSILRSTGAADRAERRT